MKVTVLGSSSGISMPGRGHASVALEAAGGLYLLDLGEPVGRAVLERRLPLERLRAAFVSHMHNDHVGGLVQLVQDLHLYHNHDYFAHVERLTLGLPAEAVDAARSWLVATYNFPERLRVALEYLPLREGERYEAEGFALVARHSTHLDGLAGFLREHPQYAGPRGEAFFFEIEAEGKRVIYSGDLGSVEDIIPAAAGADCLVLEFGHLLPLDENLAKLEGIGIKRIILTHIYPDYSDRGSLLQETADAVLPGTVIVADDGLEVEI